jgi:hypothetical protein
MYKVKLTKIQSAHDNVRTKVIVGDTNFLPELHHHFLMYAEPLEEKEANVRIIRTTPVTSIQKADGKYKFTTRNSEYELELL